MLSELAQWFAYHGWTWKVKGKNPVSPNEEEIEAVLDQAAADLFNEQPGSQLEIGRLIIVKKHKGHDVYVFAGTYE